MHIETATSWPKPEAQWIRMAGTEEAPNLYLQFARRFNLPSPAPLTLHITAVSQYRMAINGHVLGRGPAVSSPGRYYFDTFTIPTDLLLTGENLLTVLTFHDGARTETVQGFHYGVPGLLVALDGPGVSLVSDASWRVRRAPTYSPIPSMVSKWGGYKEFYHGEAEDAWESPTFDHSSWDAAEEVGPALTDAFAKVLVPLDVPRLEESWQYPTRIVDWNANLGRITVGDDTTAGPVAWNGQAIRVEPGEYGAAPAVTLDYGTLYVGYPEIEVQGAGCIFEIWYGETLDLYRLDMVRLSSGGRWQAFQRRGYRYVRLVFIALEGPVTVTAIRHRNAWYAYDDRGTLVCSDAQINRMLDVSKHTLRANTSYHYEDCPIREQALWIMDMRIMARINAYLYGNLELTAKCLRQSFAIQREDGSIASTGPKDNAMFHPDFLLHLVATLKEHHRFSGDRALVEELYPAVQRLHAFILTARDEDGLLDSDRMERGLPFLDWSFSIEKAGKTTIHNALFKSYLEDLAELATVVGDGEAARALEADAVAVGRRVHELLFDADESVYRDAWRKGHLLPTVSQQANLAAIYAGVAPEDAIPGIMRAVWDTDRYPRPFGPSYYLIVMDALARIRRFDAMLDVMRDYWGAMLDRGATTWWEVFNPGTPHWAYPHPFLGNTPTHEMDWIPISACHGWSGIPGYAVPQYLLGVDLSGLHAGRVVVDPGLPGLFESVDYAVPVAGGMLRLRFRGDGSRYGIEVVEKPEGVELQLPTPAGLH